MKGYKDITGLEVDKIWIVIHNVITAVHGYRKFWIEKRGDRTYLCWE